MQKAPDAFRTISEASDALQVPAHVLRFWESKFSQVKPVKRAGGRRYYRPADIDLLAGIKTLLYDQGMTIRGVQKLIADRGARQIAQISPLSEDCQALAEAVPTALAPESPMACVVHEPAPPAEKPAASIQPPAQEQAPAALPSGPPSLFRTTAPKPYTAPIRAGALAHALRAAPPPSGRLEAAKPLLARLEALRARLEKAK
jgi:DNA-binding transcriptional MerR regulator